MLRLKFQNSERRPHHTTSRNPKQEILLKAFNFPQLVCYCVCCYYYYTSVCGTVHVSTHSCTLVCCSCELRTSFVYFVFVWTLLVCLSYSSTVTQHPTPPSICLLTGSGSIQILRHCLFNLSVICCATCETLKNSWPS